MNSLFNINIKTVVLTTKINLNKKYVLSATEKDWTPISFVLEHTMLDNLKQNIIETMRQFIFVNELELLPQLINIKRNEENENSIDVIYGFVVNYTESLNNCFWVEFNITEEKPYSNLILEVIQNLS
jgi:hypothetical protein